MKKITLLMGLILPVIASYAQGVCVVYREEITPSDNINQLDAATAAAMREQLKQMGATMYLYVHGGESVYKEKAADIPEMTAGNAIVQLGKVGIIYKNKKTGKRISQEYIVDRKFLLTDNLTTPSWTIANDEKEILGFTCKKATNKSGYVAWFCPDIPVDDGPAGYFGLPGLILEIQLSGKIISASEVTLQCDAQKEIQEPTSGRKISREEFNALVQKKNNEIHNPAPANPDDIVESKTVTF
jgi:GLPGLI family protein